MLASPSNIKPLLDDEKESSLPGIDAYAPPGDASFRKRIPQATVLRRTDNLDLATHDFSGHAPHSSAMLEDEDDDLPPLPPLVSYCAYVRFG